MELLIAALVFIFLIVTLNGTAIELQYARLNRDKGFHTAMNTLRAASILQAEKALQDAGYSTDHASHLWNKGFTDVSTLTIKD